METRRLGALVVLVGATLLSSPPLLAQLSQQGPKLVGSGAVGDAAQGWSVALSADGNTAIIGGPADNGGAGAAWIWTRSGGVWSQQGPKLVGSGSVGNASQGWSVALSADGNTAIVGGVTDDTSVGAAWVWTRSGGAWSQQGPKLVGSGAVGNAAQGWSVGLSADGNTAIVGGPSDAGAAWVWTRSGGVWTQQGPKLVGSGAVGTANQGYSVALSADGNTALVGGPADNNGLIGAAWVWTRSGGVWSQQGAKLVGSGAAGSFVEQGISVSLSADGNTALVGGGGDHNFVGAAWVWTRSGGVWSQQGTKLVGSGAAGNAFQGTSVSLSADGNTALVGGPRDNNFDGAAWLWTRSGGVWTQQGTKLHGSGAAGDAVQGGSVSLSADGNTAILGGNADNDGAGAAWVFATASDMSITKSVNGGPLFPAGGNVAYTISIVNSGAAAASGVVVTDVLPVGTTFASATASQGTCSGTTTATCTVGTLANGGGATISLVLTTASTPGGVSNTATVTAAQFDPNPANNSFTSTISTINPATIPAASEWALIALAGALALLGAIMNRA
jgi:uncharacterized repeat protein (TIGR01451 family)